MQKFKEKLKNVPKDISLVLCSTNSQLNKVERPSVENKVLSLNNPEENQSVLIEQKQDLRVPVVYVLNMRGEPLMPTTCSKAKKLLKANKAIVVKRVPFTIRLNYPTGEAKQKVTLGIDTGYGNIGFSAVSEKKELICGNLILDGRTEERLDEKRMYRKGRRSRYWYRKPRFLNRFKPKGWLPPSIERRYQTHLSLVEKIKRLLPIIKVIVEISKFDIQKLENPEIEGKEYQQGSLYGYQNIRAYLMSREKGLCEHCKENFLNKPSHVHHRKPKSEGGNNRLTNLMLIHEKCHKEIHSKIELLKRYQIASTKSYKHSTFMSIIHKKFYNDIENLKVTYGYKTFIRRNELGLEKSHCNDAFVIANGNTQERIKPFEIIQKHRNNRAIQLNRKGFKPSIRKQRYSIQPKDIFWVGNKKYISNGIKNKGRYVMFVTDEKKNYLKIENITRVFHFGSFCFA